MSTNDLDALAPAAPTFAPAAQNHPFPQQHGTQLQHEPTDYRSFEKTYNETKYNGSNADDFSYRMRLSLGTLGILNVLKLDDSQYVVPTDPNVLEHLTCIQNYILGGMTTSTGKLWMHLPARDILRRLNVKNGDHGISIYQREASILLLHID
jgi:hypothetical protein